MNKVHKLMPKGHSEENARTPPSFMFHAIELEIKSHLSENYV
jgi:hypothetical protein